MWHLWGEEKCIPKERYRLECVGLDGRIILKCIIKIRWGRGLDLSGTG
jgi:hypothetical protein